VPNSNSIRIKPTTTSNYKVIVYSSNGCASPLSDPYYKGFVGIAEPASLGISIYPNPSNGVIYLDNKDLLSGTVYVSNLLGQRIFESQLTNDRNRLELDVPAGVYLLTLETSRGKAAMQVVVTR
jgi:hypothetical protein